MKGIVIVAAYNCEICGNLVKIDQFGADMTAPNICIKCGEKRWVFNEIQSEWITENNEALGETLEQIKREVMKKKPSEDCPINKVTIMVSCPCYNAANCEVKQVE